MPNRKQSREERLERKRIAERKRKEKIKKDPEKAEELRRKEIERHHTKKRDKEIIPISEMRPRDRKRAQMKKNIANKVYYEKKKRSKILANFRLDSEESCITEHEVKMITEPLRGIQDPLANNPDRCRFCANTTKCVDAIDRPYLKNNKMALILNDINVEIDLNDTQKICLDCDRKLLEMYCFVILVKNAQDTLLNASYEEKTETLVVKTECESPTPDENEEIDEETKEEIVDSITIGETAFVKNDVFIHKKRKCDKDKKTSKPQKKRKVDDKLTESTELMIDIKEEPIEREDDANTDIHTATNSEDRDTGPDDKPSELDIATNDLLNEMAGDGVS